jgi:hypothetical protein
MTSQNDIALKLTPINIKLFTNIFREIFKDSKEITLKIKDDTIELDYIDTSQTCLINVSLNKKDFKDFYCSDDFKSTYFDVSLVSNRLAKLKAGEHFSLIIKNDALNSPIIESDEVFLVNFSPKNTGFIKTFFQNLDKFSDMVCMKFKKDSKMILIQEINYKRTLLVIIKLTEDEFNDFYCDDITIPINLNSINAVLNKIKDNELISFFVSKNKPDFISIRGKTLGNSVKYEVQLPDYMSNLFKFDDVKFDSMVTLPSNWLHSMLIDTQTNHIKLKTIGKKTMFIFGNDVVTISIGEQGDNTKVKNIGTYESNDIFIASEWEKIAKESNIYLKEEWPLCISYTTENKSRITYMISPANLPNDYLDDSLED